MTDAQRGTYDELVQRVRHESRAHDTYAHMRLAVAKRLDPTGLPPGTPGALVLGVERGRYEYATHDQGEPLVLTTSFEWRPITPAGSAFEVRTDQDPRVGKSVTTISRDGVFPWNLKNECFDAAISDVAGAILLAARGAVDGDERCYGDLSPSPETAWQIVIDGNAWTAESFRDYERPREFKPELGNTRRAA